MVYRGASTAPWTLLLMWRRRALPIDTKTEPGSDGEPAKALSDEPIIRGFRDGAATTPSGRRTRASGKAAGQCGGVAARAGPLFIMLHGSPHRKSKLKDRDDGVPPPAGRPSSRPSPSADRAPPYRRRGGLYVNAAVRATATAISSLRARRGAFDFSAWDR